MFNAICHRVRKTTQDCENAVENQQIIDKWVREQGAHQPDRFVVILRSCGLGPSRELKDILASNDIEAIRKVF